MEGDGRQKVVPLGPQQSVVEVGSRRQDRSDFSLHQFAGLGLFGLITNGHLPPGLEQAADVVVGRVVG